MKNSPFAFFRKHQQTGMVILTVMAMFAFVFMDNFNKGGFGLGGSQAEAAVLLNSGNLSAAELQELKVQRGTINDFIARMLYTVYTAEEDNKRSEQDISRMIRMNMFGTEWPGEPESDVNVVWGHIMRLEAGRLGLVVTDPMIDSYVLRMHENRLTTTQFDTILSQMGLRQKHLYDMFRSELLARYAVRVLRPMIDHTPEQFWRYYKRLKVRQNLEVAALPVSEFAKSIKDPGDATLKAFFEEHKHRFPQQGPIDMSIPGFRQPDKVKVQYLKSTYADVEKTVPPIKDEEVVEFYEKNKDTMYREFEKPSVTPTETESTPANPEGTPETPKEPATPTEGTPPAEGTTTPEKPAEAPATETPAKPEDAKSEEAKPAEEKPAEAPAAEVKPAVEKPAETTPSEEKPAEEKPEQPCQETPATETPASETPATETPAAPEKPAEPAPAAEKPAETAPAAEEKKPEGEPAAKPDAAPTAPAEGAPAEKPTEPPEEIKYQPLTDALKDNIRDQLLNNKTQEAVKKLTEDAATILDGRNLKYNLPPTISKDGMKVYIDFNEDGEANRDDQLGVDEPVVDAKAKLNPEQTDKIPADLLAELKLQVVKLAAADLQKVGKKLGMTFASTEMISIQELNDMKGLGSVRQIQSDQFAPNSGLTIIQLLFGREQLFDATAGIDDETNPYVYWKVESSKTHIPTFTVPGIRELVLDAWRKHQAYPEAVKRAEALAKLVGTQKLEVALKGQTVDNSKDGLPITVHETADFSWMTPATPSPNMMQSNPPLLSTVTFVENADEEFFQVACEELEIGESGYAPNRDHSVVYVMRVINREPKPGPELEQLRETFMKERLFGIIPGILPSNYTDIADQDTFRMTMEWMEGLKKRYQVVFTDESKFF